MRAPAGRRPIYGAGTRNRFFPAWRGLRPALKRLGVLGVLGGCASPATVDPEARQAAIGGKIAWIPTPTELVSGSKTTIFCVSIRQNASCSYLLRNFLIRLSIVRRARGHLPRMPRCHAEETVR
jgi:hypothetical protein